MQFQIFTAIFSLSRMFDVLEKANFDWDNDELYVLGDIIDRGPESAEALHWAVEEAPDNVHFLLGNHEDMAYRALLQVVDNVPIDDIIYEDPWSWNGGYKTLNDCRELYGSDWCHKAANWIRNLPLYFIVDNKLLVHAGICNGEMRLSDDFISEGRNEWVEIPNIEREQWSQHLLWIRDRWFYNTDDYPYDIIFGHSPTTFNWMNSVAEKWTFLQDEKSKKLKFKGEPGYIVRQTDFDNGKVRYCIDTGRRNMGLLRLDDYAEFYSDYEIEGIWY